MALWLIYGISWIVKVVLTIGFTEGERWETLIVAIPTKPNVLTGISAAIIPAGVCFPGLKKV
jgi:hypothetical protein